MLEKSLKTLIIIVAYIALILGIYNFFIFSGIRSATHEIKKCEAQKERLISLAEENPVYKEAVKKDIIALEREIVLQELTLKRCGETGVRKRY